jgi:F0F1-type ATP synthase assembly protein I
MKTDLRKYTKQTTFRLIVGGIILLVVVGGGLIFFIYGPTAALSGILCLGVGLLPILIIMGILWAMEAVVRKNNES